MSGTLALGVVAALWALSGCSAGSAGPFSSKALTITGGNLQTGCLLAPLPESLEVTLTGSNGEPLAGEPVTWRVTGGSAAVSSTVRTTDPAGRARVQLALGLALSALTAALPNESRLFVRLAIQHALKPPAAPAH